jgi:amidase
MDPFAPAHELAAALRAGETTAVALAEEALERIERLDPQINAYRIVRREAALREAGEAQRRLDGDDPSPLLGIPIALKDNVQQAGEISTFGTAAAGEKPETEDAVLVQRLRAAGAVVIGRTHLPEFAIHPMTESVAWGATRNPWALDRTPGGSSGGSAAAVAAGTVPIGHATDGGGSIRFPASCCHLFGLKPQRGRVSLMPDADHWNGLSTANCVTRSVLDSAIFLDTVAGPAEGDADRAEPPPEPYADVVRRADPGHLRIAVSTRPHQPGRIDPDVRAAVRETAEALRAIGHTVEDADPPRIVQLPAFYPRYAASLVTDADRMAHPERLERGTKRQIALARTIRPEAVAWARRRSDKIARDVAPLFERYDVLLTPVAPHQPRPVGLRAGRGAAPALLGNGWTITFTAPWNLTGQPAASVPAGLARDGVPRAVQLVGRPHDEATLYALAAQLEVQRPWKGLKPPVRP